MPRVSSDYRKDSAQLSKKNGPGSTPSLGSAESCSSNYTTSSLGHLNDISSTSSSSTHGSSGQTFDTESAYTNESGKNAHQRVNHSDKKIKVKRAVEPPSRGTKVALRMFAGVNQHHGVSYDKKAGVLKTPDVKIIPTSKNKKGSRADGSSGGVWVDGERVKVPKRNEVAPKSILRGRSVPAESSYPNSSYNRHRRPTDSQHAKQQADTPDRNSATSHKQKNGKDCPDPQDDLGDLVSTSVAELDKFRRSREPHASLAHGDKHGLSADPREIKGEPATMGTDDHRRSQHRPASSTPADPLIAKYYSSAAGSKTTPATPQKTSSSVARGYPYTQHRPDAAPARRKSYERTRTNDAAHYSSPPARAASPIPGQSSHVQFLHSRPPPSPPPPTPQPQAQRIVYQLCDTSSKNPKTQYLKPIFPPYEPHPPDYLHKFSCLRLPDAILWDVHRAYGLKPVPPPAWDIKIYLLNTYPAYGAEIAKMSDGDVEFCSCVHVVYIGVAQSHRCCPVSIGVPPRIGRETEQQRRERTFSEVYFADKFRHVVGCVHEMMEREEKARQEKANYGGSPPITPSYPPPNISTSNNPSSSGLAVSPSRK